jgi:hypothetical protein
MMEQVLHPPQWTVLCLKIYPILTLIITAGVPKEDLLNKIFIESLSSSCQVL